jgi:ABC-type uncharacterized transport system substrate-binding protein
MPSTSSHTWCSAREGDFVGVATGVHDSQREVIRGRIAALQKEDTQRARSRVTPSKQGLSQAELILRQRSAQPDSRRPR